MKIKIISIITMLILCLSLCSCSQPAAADNEDLHINYTFMTKFNDGFLSLNENAQILIFDYPSMKETLLCTDAFCQHGEECSATGKHILPNYYDGRIYYFIDTMREENDNVIVGTQLCSMDNNGKNETVELSIDNLTTFMGMDSFRDNNMLYFSAYYSPWDKDENGPSDTMYFHFCSIDLKTNAFKDYGIIHEGSSSNMMTSTAIWDGKVYFAKPKGTLVLETGEFKADVEVKWAITFNNKYYVHEGEKGIVVKSIGKEDVVYEDMNPNRIADVVGEKLFFTTKEASGYLDLTTGEIKNCNKYYGDWCRVFAEYEDSYIATIAVYDEEGKQISVDYVKINKSEFQ